MASRYFPKPQPLSPKTLTWVENGVRYEKDSRVRGGKRRVKGVWTTDSIYYLWFEYLKRNAEYKKVCEGKSKKMKRIYKDFGNIFEYKGVEGFWDWWKERGQYLFGVEATHEIVEFDNAKEVVGYDDYKLIAIPKNITATTIKKRLNKIVDEMKGELKPKAPPKNSYPITQNKVDVKGLKKALLAYDLYMQKKDILEVGLIVRGFDKKEFDDWLADGRKKQTEFGVDEWCDWCDNNLAEYERILGKATQNVEKRVGWQIDAYKKDDLIDAEMRRLKTDYVRTSKKKSIRTYTHKLLNKAKANIEAVGKGTFGVGHYMNAQVKLKYEI